MITAFWHGIVGEPHGLRPAPEYWVASGHWLFGLRPKITFDVIAALKTASSPRRRGSSVVQERRRWIPAFAGMTELGTMLFYSAFRKNIENIDSATAR